MTGFTVARNSALLYHKINQSFIRSVCASAAICLQQPDGQLHLLLNRMEREGPLNHYDLWRIDEIEHWIQIEQIRIDAKTLTKEVFPGYNIMTEQGQDWKWRANPMICTMTPDFDAMSDRNELRQFHHEVRKEDRTEEMLREWGELWDRTKMIRRRKKERTRKPFDPFALALDTWLTDVECRACRDRMTKDDKRTKKRKQHRKYKRKSSEIDMISRLRSIERWSNWALYYFAIFVTVLMLFGALAWLDYK